MAAAVLVLAAAAGRWGEDGGWAAALRRLSAAPCPFHALTGLYCPGCGGTRALAALARGQVLQSLWLHPLALCGLAGYLAFMGSWTLWKLTGGRFPGLSWRDGYLWGLLGLTAANWALKNILLLAGWAVL